MNKLVATIGLAAAVGAGAFAVGAVLPVGAQEDPPPETETEAEETEAESGGRGPYGAVLDEALAGLVENGTLTQEQADAVKTALRAAADDGPGRGARHRLHHRIVHNSFHVAADTIGVTHGQLRRAVARGESVADVAEANGVDPQAVIDELVATGGAAVDEAVANGRLTAEEGEEAKGRLPQAAENFVNFTRPGNKPGNGN